MDGERQSVSASPVCGCAEERSAYAIRRMRTQAWAAMFRGRVIGEPKARIRPRLVSARPWQTEQFVKDDRSATKPLVSQELPTRPLCRDVAQQRGSKTDRLGKSCLYIGMDLLLRKAAAMANHSTQPIGKILFRGCHATQSREIQMRVRINESWQDGDIAEIFIGVARAVRLDADNALSRNRNQAVRQRRLFNRKDPACGQ